LFAKVTNALKNGKNIFGLLQGKKMSTVAPYIQTGLVNKRVDLHDYLFEN
jgi:hypothetical protein